MEFFSAIKFDYDTMFYRDQSMIQFRLGEEDRWCSVMEFARRCGLYTKEEAESMDATTISLKQHDLGLMILILSSLGLE